ncbi:MAG: DUF262 and DUF1524 domain-containing protein [Methylotenera sp.]|nr:DUF262 and DUF1524 domain-containing protein [Methylotenera sp.]
MKANEDYLLQVIRKAPQFEIPIYQRSYSWKLEQCQQLWNDLIKAGKDTELAAHFIGAMVYVQKGLATVTKQEPLLVIDGQQRLTTTTLLIAALVRYFETHKVGEILGAFSANKLRNRYLFNPDEDGERQFKLILSEADKDTLIAILKDSPLPSEHSQRIKENFDLFQDLIAKHRDQLESICQGLEKLMVVEVALDSLQDNPQLIFESMNSTGLELSQADLIRNYILMGLSNPLQTELYKIYWRPMEKGFGQTAYAEHFDAFMRHYLTAKTSEIPNVRDVYTSFKTYAVKSGGDVNTLVQDISLYADYYRAMALDAEINPMLKRAFHDLRELKVDVSYPFLLDVYHEYKENRLSVDALLQILRLTESYVFRRAVCDIPTNSLNKIFAGMSRSIQKDNYLESVKAFFLLLPSYRRFPTDIEFKDKLKKRDLYNFRSRNYWLRRLENNGRRELVSVENYTIEHILPQNEDLSQDWQSELGSDWQQIQQLWLHTLGNLTLTAYNSEYSDRSFNYKRSQVKDKDGNLVGLAYSPLKLNAGLGEESAWNESAIKSRADRLSEEAIKVWAAPKLNVDVLDNYRPISTKLGQKYSIDDHPKLKFGITKDLFDILRKEILAIDPCVSEEFQKFYVAYKAESNFVDIEPRASSLRLTLNMSFQDINDPQGRCKDVSNVGHQGNGDVDIRFESVAELPYVMSLIRQSFDLQKFSV